jgi:hypothetical protein
MKLRKIFIYCFLITIFPILVSAQYVRNADRPLTARDKTEIVEQVFADGFGKLMKDEQFSQCTIPLVNGEQVILIRTKEPTLFPKTIGEYRFKLLTEKQIESEIKSNNGDCFFELSPMVKHGNNVKVTLWRWIQVVSLSNGKSLYPSRWVAATGRIYEATRVKGVWRIKFLNGTAIVS